MKYFMALGERQRNRNYTGGSKRNPLIIMAKRHRGNRVVSEKRSQGLQPQDAKYHISPMNIKEVEGHVEEVAM